MNATFDYPRNFLLLTGCAALLAVTPGWDGLGPVPHFALYGALHASVLMLSLRRSGSVSRRAFFVVGATLLSFMTATMTVHAGRFVSALPFRTGSSLLLAASSGAGAFVYALWVRWHWIQTLRLRAASSIALGCMITTVTAAMTEVWLFHGLGYLWVAFAWWGAFSVGLWRLGDRAPVR